MNGFADLEKSLEKEWSKYETPERLKKVAAWIPPIKPVNGRPLKKTWDQNMKDFQS